MPPEVSERHEMRVKIKDPEERGLSFLIADKDELSAEATEKVAESVVQQQSSNVDRIAMTESE